MADKINPNNSSGAPTPEQDMVNFSVMPHSGNMGKPVSSPAQNNFPRPQMDSGTPPPPPEHPGIWHSKITYVVISLLVLIVLGGLAYFLLWSDSSSDSDNNDAVSKIPKVFVKQYFGVDLCGDMSKCGDEADPDTDGLTNYEEFVEQSDPTKPDSDEDGLADGDELNIYITNPVNKYTDNRPAAVQAGYSDGSQIKNDYDPITPGLKMTEVRKLQIEDRIIEFGLHEPTITTLQTSTEPVSKSVTIFITNGKFDPPISTVNVNDTVIWLNKDATPHQIMSNVHPAHDILPDLASGILATNQTYSYKFTKAGIFSYHDENTPAVGGTIEVK